MSRLLQVFDDERGTLKVEFDLGMALLHATFRKPVSAMRFAKSIFSDLKAWLKSMGHDEVFVIIREGDEKLYHFQQIFGFREHARKNGNILMRQEC